MEIVTKSLEFVKEVGIIPFAVVVLIVAYVILFIRMSQMAKDQSKLTNTFIKTFVSPKEKKHEEFRKEAKANVLLGEKLSEIRAEFNANLVSIYTLHNGDLKKNGVSFNKFSCTHEKIKPGFSMESGLESYKNLPISIFPYWIDQLIDHGEVLCDNIKLIEFKEPAAYKILSKKGINSIYSFAMYDECRNLLGWVSLEFAEYRELSSEETQELRKCVQVLNSFNYNGKR